MFSSKEFFWLTHRLEGFNSQEFIKRGRHFLLWGQKMINKEMLICSHFLPLRILLIFLDSDIVETSSFQIQKED